MSKYYVATIVIDMDSHSVQLTDTSDGRVKVLTSFGAFPIYGQTAIEVRDKAIATLTNLRIWNKDGKEYFPAWENLKKLILEKIRKNPNGMYWSVDEKYMISVGIHQEKT